MLQKLFLHGGKLYFIERIGQYSQSLFDTCGQSTCPELKKHDFCPIDHSKTAHLYIIL